MASQEFLNGLTRVFECSATFKIFWDSPIGKAFSHAPSFEIMKEYVELSEQHKFFQLERYRNTRIFSAPNTKVSHIDETIHPCSPLCQSGL